MHHNPVTESSGYRPWQILTVDEWKSELWILSYCVANFKFNTGEFPKDGLAEAVDQRGSIIPLLLEEHRHAAADPEALVNKGESYIRHIYAMYMLAQFREAAAYPLLVDFVSTPDEIVMHLTGDVVTEDLGCMLASL